MDILLPTLLAYLAAVIPVVSQDRRSRDEPEMSINARGRTGTCDVLMFDSSKKWLFTGGDDKVIRAWQLGEQGLTDRLKTYRWPGWREQRGGIKTLSIAKDGRILVAGFGLKNGLVMLLDEQGEVIGTNNVSGRLPEMPRTTIFSSTFAPSEQAAFFGDSEGRIWKWDLKGPAIPVHAFPPIAPGVFNRVLTLQFTAKNVLHAIAESGDVLKITNPETQPKATVEFKLKDSLPPDADLTRDTRLARAFISEDGKVLGGLMVQRYAVFASVNGQQKSHRDAGVGRFYRSLAHDATRDRLALAVATGAKLGEFLLPGNSEIQIHVDAFTKKSAVASAIPFSLDAEVMTFSPTDGRLIVAGGDNHELAVWNLSNVAKPERQRGITGHGRGIWGVRITKDGKSFAWQSERNASAKNLYDLGQGDWHAFDMDFGKPRTAGELATTLTEADGWKVIPSKKSRFTWLAVKTVDGETKELELSLDPDREQTPQCYTLIPAKAGQKTRVAIGHLYGFSIFELGDTKADRVMLTTGHAGEVRTIAVSEDGTWAVTGSRDQTLAGWSLNSWPSNRFGASLVVAENGLLVNKIDLGSPAWEMGLREKDVIVMVARPVNNRPVFLLDQINEHQKWKINPNQLVNSVAVAQKELLNPTPGIEYNFAWNRPNEKSTYRGLSTIRTRPLWRFFPAYDHANRWTEWVAWTWRGSRYLTSPGGDWLVGFQLNHPFTIVEGRPRFYEANLLKQSLNLPRGVLKLMQQRDVAKMLLDEYGENATPISIGDQQPMPIDLKLASEKVPASGVKAKVSIEMFANNPDLVPQNVELWVNDHRVKQWAWPQNQRLHSTEITIPAEAFRPGENQVTVVSVNDAGGRAMERTTIVNERSADRPKLVGLLVGINDYETTRVASEGRRDEFTDLKFAGNDAAKLRETWLTQAGDGRLYAKEGIVLLPEKFATRVQILKQLAELKQRVTSDDVAVIFLAGHGHWVKRPDATGKNRRKPPMMFVFCCRGFNPEKPLETGITDEELVNALAECPARKLLLLDACHSGQTASESVLRHLVPEGQGPAIIAACDQQESSLEHDKFGHGLFTAAVIESMTKRFDQADTGSTKDGNLDPQELYDFLGDRIREMLVEINTVPTRQQPRSFPLDLPRFTIAQNKK